MQQRPCERLVSLQLQAGCALLPCNKVQKRNVTGSVVLVQHNAELYPLHRSMIKNVQCVSMVFCYLTYI